jgi:hypothetical protein
MAIPTVKSTYSLDLETASALERLSAAWQTSKSGVIRRMAAQAVLSLGGEPSETSETPVRPVSAEAAKRLAALRDLQRGVREQGVDLAAWRRSIQAARR